MYTFLFLLTVTLFTTGYEINELKFEELSEVTVEKENSSIASSDKTLKMFVKWDDWSCCSACCCPKTICGVLATDSKCEGVVSTKHRRGNFALSKIKDTGNVDMEKLFEGSEVIGLEDVLSVNSTELKNELNTVRLSLAQELSVPPETLSVFQVISCKDDVQKLDCWELTKCQFGTSDFLPEKEIAITEIHDVCENVTIIVLREAYNILSLMPEKLYRLQIDRTIGDGNIVTANFTYDGKTVPKLTNLKDCFHQPKRVFQHPNGEDLILRFTKEQLSKNSKIVAVISYENPKRLEITVEIVLQTKKRVQQTLYEEGYFVEILISSLALCTLILLGLSIFFLR